MSNPKDDPAARAEALERIKETPADVPPTDAERKHELAEKNKRDKAEMKKTDEANEALEESLESAQEIANPSASPKRGQDWFDAQHGASAEWFREQHKADLERELEGARLRGDKDYEKNVKAELAKLGHGQAAASKRPRGGAAKETR